MQAAVQATNVDDGGNGSSAMLTVTGTAVTEPDVLSHKRNHAV